VEGIIPHAIDMKGPPVDAEFQAKIRRDMLESKPFKVLLNVSHNNARKGLDKLLVAHKVIGRLFPEAFLILHTQALRGYGGIDIKKYADILGLKRIWWTQMAGLFSEAKMNALYDMAYLYVCSSYAEGFCLPLIESYRFNLPIVAVDAPPMNEIVKDKETGLLFPYDHIERFLIHDLMDAKMHIYDVDDLIDAITLLMLDEGLRNRMSSKIEEVKAQYDSSIQYPKFMDYLEGVG